MKLFSLNIVTKILLVIIFLTSSLDRILKFNIGGFNVRAGYIIAFILIIISLIKIASNMGRLKIITFPGITSLTMWTLVLILFIPNTTFLTRNIGYMLWHMVHCFLIFSMVVLADGWNKFEGLFKLYVYSFIAFAIFGILQLLCGLFGFSLFVSDWWLPRFPRVNGFTYEPSYFGTYLLIGWGMLFILKVYKNNIFKQKTISRFLAIMTLGMIVTSSRMTILIIALIYSGYLMLNIVKSLYKFRINTKMLQLIAISIFLITFTILMVLSQLKKIDFLFTGVGLSGKSSSSVNQRSNESMETFKIFTRSPFIGVSLGGIPSARALQNGIVISDNETAKKYEGLNIFLEMLASGGIIGFVFFLSYIFFLIGRSVHLYRKINNDNLNLSVVLLSLVFSFICELAILSMNQNISRLYLWVHIGMLTVAIRNAVDYREFAIKAKQNLI